MKVNTNTKGGNELPNTSVRDIYPPERKGEGIGIVSCGWWLGMIIGLAIRGYLVDTQVGFPGAYYNGAIFGFISMIILLLVRYKPLKIAENLSEYYPYLKQKKERFGNPVFSPENKINGSSEDIRSTWQIFRLYPIQVQFWITVLCQGEELSFLFPCLFLVSFTLNRIFLILLMLPLGSGYCACMNTS